MFSLLTRTAASTTALRSTTSRSLSLFPSLRSSQGYGSPDVTNPTPEENSGSASTSDGKTATSDGKDSGVGEQKKGIEGADEIKGEGFPSGDNGVGHKGGEAGQPKPNGDPKDSAGDKSKPHYVCDTEKSGSKGETAELKKADK